MKHKYFFLSLTLIFLLFIISTVTVIEAGVIMYRDIRYFNDSSGAMEWHKLDLYRPTGKALLPVLVFAHGGGLIMGNKSMYPGLGERLANMGFLVAMTGYGHSPEIKFPEHAKNVARAITWLQRNAGKYGGDPNKIFLMGHSAGGYLVSLLALDHKYLEEEGGNPYYIKGVISISGIYTIYSLRAERRDEFFQKIITPAFEDDFDTLKDASPLTHVNSSAPPFLILWAEKELPFIRDQGENMLRAMEEAGCNVTGQKIKGRNHSSIMTWFGTREDPAGKIFKRWLKRVGK
ncbi:MAG: alpha/beta hydrolase [Candidatus Eremiobacteraeota bacterium]|nr:alpha/beta hydrolase [Candidatus Eremiobacteraeota bacterium]